MTCEFLELGAVCRGRGAAGRREGTYFVEKEISDPGS